MPSKSQKMGKPNNLIDKLFRIIEIVIAIFLGVMIVFTFLNVILRQFSLGFAWTEEVTRITFIYLVYLGAIIAARENRHLMIDTLINKVSPAAQKVLYIIIQGTIIWLMGMLAMEHSKTPGTTERLLGGNALPCFSCAFCRCASRCFGYHISLVNLYKMLILRVPVLELFTDHGTDDAAKGVE
jgi:hypothetical protein